MMDQIISTMIGGLGTLIVGALTWFATRHFRKKEDNEATLTLLVNNMGDVKKSMERLHVRMSELFVELKETNGKIDSMNGRVHNIEGRLDQ